MRRLAALLLTAFLATTFAVFAAPAEAATPTADSGPSIVAYAGTDAHLTGTAGDADGDPVQIKWLHSTLNGGDFASCTFSGPSSYTPITAAGLAPTLNCTQPGGYLLQLVAADGTSSFDSIGALVTFTVNHRPVVDSGPNVTVPAGTNAGLAGTASDADGDPLEINWIKTVVSGGNLASCTFSFSGGFQPLTAAGLAPTLNCTQAGSYLLQLEAGDGQLLGDDIGTLVTFTAPDPTPAVCSVLPRSRPLPALRIRVSDPQSGVRALRVSTHYATATPAAGRYAPAVRFVDVAITPQHLFFVNSTALINHSNGAGVVGSCLVTIKYNGTVTISQ